MLCAILPVRSEQSSIYTKLGSCAASEQVPNRHNSETEQQMPDYPVMFTVRDTVSGNGFLAGVTLTGRAVMCKEEDGKWWIYGVRPGAIAESGTTPQEAFLRFRNSYKNVLFDYASCAAKYENFRDAVDAFYHQPDNEEEARWMSAFKALRSGEAKPKRPCSSQRCRRKIPRSGPRRSALSGWTSGAHGLAPRTTSATTC